MAFSMEDMLRMVDRLVRNGGETGMYEGWSADQELLRRLQLTGDPLYAEPYTRTAQVSDDELKDQLEGVLRIFMETDQFTDDGRKSIQEQQNAGNDPADVTKKIAGKYPNPYQAQISGEGFESLMGKAITEMVDRKASQKALALTRQLLSLHAKLAKEDEDRKERERKDEEDRKARELDSARKDREAKEAEDAALARAKAESASKEAMKCKECGEALKDGETHDHGAHESAIVRDLKAQIQGLQSQMAQMQAAQPALGSRQFGETVPGGANAPGILQPTAGATPDTLAKVNTFMSQGLALMQKYQNDPSAMNQVREGVFNAMSFYKQGGTPNISHPEVAQLAKSLGLPNENIAFGGLN